MEGAEIRKVVDSVGVVDTHEHLMREVDRLQMKADPLHIFLPHYLSSDLVSSGMKMEELNLIRSTETPLEERWRRFLRYWERVENTGYAQAIKIAVRDLYGIERFESNTWKILSEALARRQQPGFHTWVLKTMGGIDVAINDVSNVDVDQNVVPVMRFEDFATAVCRDDLQALASRTETPIHTLDDLVKTLEFEFARVAKKVVGVKIGLAYFRTLFFDKVTFSESEKAFNRIYRARAIGRREVMPYPGRAIAVYTPRGPSFEDCKPLQDYVVHRILQLSERNGLPVQIHTGLQEGNENILVNSDPTLLTNLFMEYKDVKFDIFHAGYPYFRELAALSKNFPNVYVDLCWMHVISPRAARTILSEWLDMIPSNKILAFGGDYRFVEGSYGHIVLARRNVARVLEEKVSSGELEPRNVTGLSSRLLRENAKELFSLKI